MEKHSIYNSAIWYSEGILITGGGVGSFFKTFTKSWELQPMDKSICQPSFPKWTYITSVKHFCTTVF